MGDGFEEYGDRDGSLNDDGRLMGRACIVVERIENVERKVGL